MGSGPTDFRSSRSLDGEWTFLTDPSESGVQNDWPEGERTWPDRARTIEVPHAWQELSDCREYTGRAWYTRTVELDRSELADHDAILRFGAVDYETTVWVNGTEVGTHRGGYLPFEFDVTSQLETGANTITVAVTDPEDLAEIPHGKQGDPWYGRVSGIWQSVHLDFRPPTRVTDIAVVPDVHTDTATIELSVRSNGRDLSGIQAVVEASRGETTVRETTTLDGERAELVLAFDDPAYWHPDDPALYDLTVHLRDGDEHLDRTTDYFGLRNFETDGEQFLLNGDPITMRGVLEQGYYPKTLYRPPDGETIADEIARAKDLGFNLIRKHLKPAHPAFLERADRQGILVWEEPANPMRYTERSRSEFRQQLWNLLDRDYNHPSVVVWSLYNEEWGIGHADGEETLWVDEQKQQFLADTYRELRERDPTRLICDNSGWAHVRTDVNDFHRYFVSPDQQTEWEADLDYISHHPADNYATTEFDDTDAPIVLSELGTWGFPDVPALREYYDGDPPWFDRPFPQEAHKRPAGIDRRFETSDLSAVFGTYESLAEAWQRREYVSLKHLLETTRTRPSVAGYVLTQLSDVEWEFNGLLEYQREPKRFSAAFDSINGPVIVVLDLDAHVLAPGEQLRADVAIVNDTGDRLDGTVTWSLAETTGSIDVDVDAHDVTRIQAAVETTVGLATPIERRELSAEFQSPATTTSTTEPVVVVDESRIQTPDVNVFAEGPVASRLAERGISVTHTLDRADVALTAEITDDVRALAEHGGDVVQIPGSDGSMAATSVFEYYDVPPAESWIRTTSFLYQDSPLFDQLSDTPRLGWELNGLYPLAVVTDLDRSRDTIHAGYVEGWLANWASPLVTRAVGDGTMTALCFPVSDTYGYHSVATVLSDRLLRQLG